MLVGTMVGIHIFNLPNSLVADTYEDAWISLVLAALYPLYMSMLAIYLISIYPNENILTLSKKCMGNFFGSIANFIFLLNFIIGTISTVSGINNIYRVYAVEFLKPLIIVSLILFVSGILAYTGLKSLARVNTLAFFILLIVLSATIASLTKGSYLNLFPLFKSSISNIEKGIKDASFSYLGIELLFLIYPLAEKNSSIKKSILAASAITMCIYLLVIELCIYYYGSDILLKSTWAFVTITESLSIPIINNFRVVFASLWLPIALKEASNYFYACELIIRDFLRNIKRENLITFIYIVLLCITMNFVEHTNRIHFLNITMPLRILYNTMYISVICMIITVKRMKINDKK
jgi:spore germination protein (amino acid permease)